MRGIVLGDRGGAGMQGRMKITAVALAACSVVLLASGCTSTNPSPAAQAAVEAAETEQVPHAIIEFEPHSDSVDLPPGAARHRLGH